MLWPHRICPTACWTIASLGRASANAHMYMRFARVIRGAGGDTRDRNVPMSLRLVSLHVNSNGAVIADLDSGTQEGRVLASFYLNRSEDLITAFPDPYVFRKFATSIEEVRQITAAVIAFSVASKTPM